VVFLGKNHVNDRGSHVIARFLISQEQYHISVHMAFADNVRIYLGLLLIDHTE